MAVRIVSTKHNIVIIQLMEVIDEDEHLIITANEAGPMVGFYFDCYTKFIVNLMDFEQILVIKPPAHSQGNIDGHNDAEEHESITHGFFTPSDRKFIDTLMTRRYVLPSSILAH